MAKRIIEIGNPADVSLFYQQMKIEQDDKKVTIPLEDVGVLIFDHPDIRPSHSLLTACMEHNVVIILCNSKHTPVALSLPIAGNSLHVEVLRNQIALSDERKRALWKTIIQRKIGAQYQILRKCEGNDNLLLNLSQQVSINNASSSEAQAARFYWKQMFGSDFRRGTKTGKINSFLNYGYALVRAVVARSIVATGLHPSIGIHHKNKYNPYCLADDLMEPLRPLVDNKVHSMIRNSCKNKTEMEREDKETLLGILIQDVSLEGNTLSLQDAVSRYTTSFKESLNGNDKLRIPIIW